MAAAEGRARLDAFLAAHLLGRVTRSQLARHVETGAVSVNGEICKIVARRLKPGDVVHWRAPAPVPVTLVAEAIPLVVLYEDADLVVIDKPPGLVVHPAAGHASGTLVNALLAHCQDLRGIGGELRPGIVHRLDKDTSGVMVVAKDERTLARLAAAWKTHDIDRAYEAIGVGAPAGDGGRIETLHGRDPRDRKKFSVKVKVGKPAITDWRVLERLGGATRLEARLLTGRTHQVRLHFAELGCPLLGDPVYGRPPRDPELRAIGQALGRQALHARRLGFAHPRDGRPLVFETPPPADLQVALAALRGRTGG